MTSLYVVGAKQRDFNYYKSEWHRHEKGVILQLSTETGEVERRIEYVSPPEVCAENEPSIVFKAATLLGNNLYVPTQTEILIYEIPSLKQVGYVSLPCFNDVHHITPSKVGNLLVANTGLDMVVEVSPLGETLRVWNVLGEEPWQRFSQNIDYRKVVTTKPHKSHPNYVFEFGEEIWVTRFEQKDAICLTNFQRRISLDIERCHDGIVYKDKVYFTTVNGYIIVADLESCKVNKIFNLNTIGSYDATKTLGWCRGLDILDEHRIIVGFSRLRPTKFVENIQWVKYKIGMRNTLGHLPSRIALYDLKEEKICWEYNLEEREMNVVFSVHLLEN
jgi:hypothetical protein